MAHCLAQILAANFRIVLTKLMLVQDDKHGRKSLNVLEIEEQT